MNRLSRKHWIFTLSGLLSIFVLFAWLGGCKTEESATSGTTATVRPESTGPGNKVEGDTIPIGIIASLSGSEKPWGEESVRGAQLAVDEFNAEGGLNGKQVVLLVEDTGGQPEQGKSATERLITEKKVIAVLGEVASGVTAPSAQVAQEKGVPIVSIGSTRVDITDIGNMVFRVCYTDDFQGAMMAKFAYEDLGLRRVAILTDRKLPYSVGLSEMFREYFTRLGGKIVTEEFYEKGQTDFKAQLTNIKAANPDGLFCSGYFTEIGPIARQRKEVGLNVPMFGGDGWDSRELLQAGGEGIIGGYYSNHYSNLEDRLEVKAFVSKYKAKYGEEPANAMSALGYDAAGVVLDALKRAKSLDSRALRDAIAETKNFPGVSGTITIGPDGNAQKPGLVLEAKLVNGKPAWVPFKRYEWFDPGLKKKA
ncbi:MAG TPA: ABC transporter substrate-binding protein [Fimbriimonadales bacterium]|nr:ABC transporter substrate-binding protein [Fimbriimonadales bacterium]